MSLTTTLTIDDIAKNPEYGVQLLCQDDWKDHLGSLVSSRAACLSMLRSWLHEKHSAEETERILGPLYDKVSKVEAFTSIYESRALFGWWLRQQSISEPLASMASWSETNAAQFLLSFKCLQVELGNTKFHNLFSKGIYPEVAPIYERFGLDASFISQLDSHFQNKSNLANGQVFSERKKVAAQWRILLERVPVTSLVQVVHLVGRMASPIGLWEAIYDRLRQESDREGLNALMCQWPADPSWQASVRRIIKWAPEYFQQSWKCPDHGFCVMASLVEKSGLSPFLSSAWAQSTINTCDALDVKLDTATLLNMLATTIDDAPRVEFDFSL